MQKSSTRRNLLAFHTGLMAFDYFRFPQPPYRGKRWQVELITPKTEVSMGGAYVGGEVFEAKEVVVQANSELDAQKAADLIHAARLVLDGSAFFSHISPGEHAPIHAATGEGAADVGGEELAFLNRTRVITSNIPLACMVAARASLRVGFIYALAKLRFSLETFSVPFIELDPSHSPTIPKSQLPDEHVRLAFAILTAWSCVEELGFEIRASSKTPSKLPSGKWNPVVQTELEERLRRGHINLNEGVYWNLRGQRTLIERKKAPIFIQRAPWARYDVRDGQMNLIDAIHYVSYLRSWVAAHKTDKRMLRMLSAYDVSNAQGLARRLLLESVRLWRYWGREEEEA